jgi:hypothetical protein
MGLNVPQYNPSGDMMSTINDYWSQREGGSDHNAEWAGANPAEYWTRKYGEALNWKRGQAELEARRQAELLRQQQEQKKAELSQQLEQKRNEYLTRFNETKSRFEQQAAQSRTQNAALKQSLSNQVGADKSKFSDLMTGLLSQYDQGFNTFSNKLNEFKDYSSQTGLLSQMNAENMDAVANQLLALNPQQYNPNMYQPDINTLSSAATNSDSLFNQAVAKYKETYGYDQSRVDSAVNPLTSQYNTQRGNVSQGLASLGQSFVDEASNLYNPGLYDQRDYNAAVSQEQNLSQRLRQNEQGVLSMLNDMFNSASTFANKADLANAQEKSNRLNERATIVGQQQESQLANKLGQAENSSAQQVANRRQNTMMSFNPQSQQSNLLSFLTRGY